MKLKEKNGTGTIDLTPLGPDGGIAMHTDEDHVCVGEFRRAKPGQNLAGLHTVAIGKDGTYEPIDTGAGKRFCDGGPAQVATPAYRDNWEATFGSRGGVS